MTEGMVFDYSAAVAMLDRLKTSDGNPSSKASGGAGGTAAAVGATRNGAAASASASASSSSAQSSYLPSISPAVAAAAAAQKSRGSNRGGGPTAAARSKGSMTASGSNGTTGATEKGSPPPTTVGNNRSAAAMQGRLSQYQQTNVWGGGDTPAAMAENSAARISPSGAVPFGAPSHPAAASSPRNNGASGEVARIGYCHQSPPNAGALGLQPMYGGNAPPPQEVELDNRTAVQSMSSVSNPSGAASGSGSFGSRSRGRTLKANDVGQEEDHPSPPISVGGGCVLPRRKLGGAGQLPPTVEESVALEQLAAAEARGTASIPYSSGESSVTTLSTNPSSGMMRIVRGGVAMQQDGELPPASTTDQGSSASASVPSSGVPSSGGVYSGPIPASTEEGTQAAHRAALGAQAPTAAAPLRASNERQAPGAAASAAGGHRGSTTRSLFRRSSGGERPARPSLRQQAAVATRRASNERQRQPPPSARRSGDEKELPQPRQQLQQQPASSRRASNEEQPQEAHLETSRRSSNERQPPPSSSRRSSNDPSVTSRRSSNDSSSARPVSRRASNEERIAESRLKMLGTSTPFLMGEVNEKRGVSSASARKVAVVNEGSMHMSMVDLKFDPKEAIAAANVAAMAAGAAAAEPNYALAPSSSSASQAPTTSTASKVAPPGGVAQLPPDGSGAVVPHSDDAAAAVARQRTPPSSAAAPSPDAERLHGSSSGGSGGRRSSVDNSGSGSGAGRTVAKARPGLSRKMSVQEIMLERELTGLNEDFNKSKSGAGGRGSRRASLSHASMGAASRRSSNHGGSTSASAAFHESSGATGAASIDAGGGKVVQFSGTVAAGAIPAVGEEVNEDEKRQMWNDWYERRRRPASERRPRRGSNIGAMSPGVGKDWREVLIDGIAGFGKHAPRCVLGDVAAFLRTVAASNDAGRGWGDEGDAYHDGLEGLEEIEAIAEDNHSLSSISDAGGGHDGGWAKRDRYPVAPGEDSAGEAAGDADPVEAVSNDNEVTRVPLSETQEEDIDDGAAGDIDDFADDIDDFADDENDVKKQRFPRRPSLGFDTRGIHRPNVIPLQIGLEDETNEGGDKHPRPALVPGDSGRDVAPVGDTPLTRTSSRQSIEGALVETPPKRVDTNQSPANAGFGDASIQPRRASTDGIARQSSGGRLNRRASNESGRGTGMKRRGSRGSLDFVPKRGSMDTSTKRGSMDTSSNRRGSMGSSRPGMSRLASNRSAFISVVSDATTVAAGHQRRKPRRGSGGPLALATSMSPQEAQQPPVSPRTTFDLPHHGSRESALLFIDISGFTKLSTLLDIEDLSRAINNYFDIIVSEVLSHGGDVLKFAGDALFAEWQVTSADEDDGTNGTADFGSLVGNTNEAGAAEDSPRGRSSKPSSEGMTLTECVMAASFCGATICRKCSGYKVYATAGESKNSRSRRSSAGARKKRSVAKLDVHCGIGVGRMVGLHVSNVGIVEGSEEPSERRREFLFLGSPIDQVATAEGIAQTGELVASPEVVRILSAVCNMPESIATCDGPSVVARRSECFVTSKIPWEPTGLAHAAGPLAAGSDLPSYESLDAMCDDLDSHTLEMLRDQLSLYVHPVVRNDQLAKAEEDTVQPLSQEQHRAEAELRSVYVMFILPLISAQVSGDPEVDSELFQKLSDIMRVTNRELVKFSGHLRQFIVDDKGVVLIGTFGLRGSTFPNMVPENALPATLSIHKALKSELNVDNKVGATFGKVYCGVVGGVHRHEFAVLGPSVNLAARLMASKENDGVLVDEAVQSHAKAKFSFRSHSLVTAKGYAKPVPTFQPLDSINQKIDDSIGIVGRKQEIKQVMDVTRKIIEISTPIPTQLIFLGGESGVGKTAIIVCLIEKIKTFCALYYKHVALCRSSSRESEQLVPLSGFKSVLLYAVREYCMFDGTVSIKNQRDSLSSLKRSMRRDSGRFRRRDSMASQTSTIEVPYMSKIRWVCSDLGYDPAYADIVGARLLGLEDADEAVCTVDGGEVPKLENIVEFLAASFIRFTKHVGVTLVTIDDVQWIDALSWKVIHALWENGDDMLILGGLRESDPGGRRRRSSAREWDSEDEGSRFTHISLGALEKADVKVLISKALYYHESSIDDDFVNEVYEKTGGIPVFALELLENIKRNDLVEVQESGLLGLKSIPQAEQGKNVSQGPGVVDELFLQRLDALDLPVRKVLQSSAVLGMEFFLSDVLRVNPEYESAEILQKALDSAVVERILVEEMEAGSDEDSVKGHCGEMKNAQLASTNRSFRFSQAMWRDIVLRTMLKDRQMDLHRNIAKAMEADGVSEFSDTRTLLKLFDHWKACCDFLKAAPLALAIGARLEEWESSQQSLDLYCNALAMWRTDTKVNASLETLGAWYEPSLSSIALAFVVRLKTRVGKCLHDIGDEQKGALAYRDAYLIMTKLPASKRVDRSLIFPVISGLWMSIPWDQIVSANDSNFSVEQELVQRFVDEAQAYGDPIHCCRAFAMQGSLYSRMSDFPRALEVQRKLECVYSYSEHSSGIFEAYGSDSAALSFGNSVQWYDLISDEAMANKQMDFVLNKLLPKFHPVAVHDSMGVLFPVLMVMKSTGMAKDAIIMFQNHVLDRFKALGIKSTYFYPLYKPTSFILELARRDDSGENSNDMLEEVQEWALKGEKISPIPMLERNGQFIQGEACWRLARRKSLDDPLRMELIRRGTSLLKRVMKKVQHDGSYAFMVKEAYFIYTDLQKMKETKPAPVPAPSAETGCACCVS